MSLVLIVVFCSEKVKAQNAESLFNDYYKLGIVMQFNIFDAANISPTNNNNINYEIFKSKMPAFGIAYNFYQYKNWNFKAELQLQWFGDADGITILEPENIANFSYRDESITEPAYIGYLPLTIEYVFLNTGSFSFSLGGGAGLTYYWHYDIHGSSGLAINDITLFEAYEISDYPLFYLSNHVQASVYFKRKELLFQASLIYKKSYTSFRQGTYEFKNLKTSPDISGGIDQSGDFWGISMIFYFKKKSIK